MTDYFAVLGMPRRPWLDPEALREKFHALVAVHHPDVSPSGSVVDFSLLNSAYQTLHDPHARLRHLLILETDDVAHKPQPSPEITSLFTRIFALQQTIAAFLDREAKARGPLAHALLSGEKIVLIESLRDEMDRLQFAQTERFAELRAIDAAWPAQKPFARLHALMADLGFLKKWIDGLQAAVAKIEL
ncbi:MAG: molecular chaperone HscB [Chthoniobacter sp.]|nr:molecular chaperone HscB [Chthoniobacter sp.]